MDDPIGIGDRDRLGRDMLPVAQTGDGVAETEDFFHPMGDVNNRDAALLEFAEQLKEVFAFADRKGAGRFVHYDDLRLGPESSSYLDKLFLPCGELADRLINVEIGFDL